ncbi:site-2 protease family protein [Aeoliella mucimassa]|uniref:Regulator of sigma-E protease RseP n=1 Tax=Aeoliella mucimassa TaxID=2527972 RepID=A0A518AHD7_9BACT|nr:site-2 protease family protein [Aeoliella mucimassa]QDU54122.1 Regulator of sigma-E protease RseP [Aeoliella mucimassa]
MILAATGYGPMVLAILAAALGLGFIIFVHELGHFLVAKACGVKCDKFMIGFDIGGYKIGKQYGETYYGIGILPLGGYVRMMGQNDDPRMSEEQIKESEATVGQEGVETKEIMGPDGKMHQVDARSYIAKTVPQRMAIISAGVIMNVIFAFVFAMIAFTIGVPSQPSIISGTDPGAPAWTAGIGVGDQIVRINDRKTTWYDQLRGEVMLSSEDDPLELEVLRVDGESEVVQLKSSQERIKIPQIGVIGPVSLKLSDTEPTVAFTPADKVQEKIPAGSTIVAVNDQPVNDYRELQAVLVANASQSLSITLQPPAEKAESGAEPVLPEPVTVEVQPNQAQYVGLVMKMGPITAVQKGSPAEAAGLKKGDLITAINGTPVGMVDESTVGWDPRTLSDKLSAMAQSGETVELTVEHPADKEAKTEAASETISVPLRKVTWMERPVSEKSPASAPALGIAYYLLNEVVGVVPDSPAAKIEGIKPGDKIASVKLVVEEQYSKKYKVSKKPLELTDKQQAWAVILQTIQNAPPETKLELQVAREGRKENETVQVGLAMAPDQYIAPRGVKLTPVLEDRYGESIGEQASMAWGETKHALLSVYRFLYRLVNGDIDARLLGGPVTIARASYMEALKGPGTLLLFLTLISANLAVVNFLPIPVLDGGHMVFLAYEGIFRRPPNETFAGVLNLAGLAFIVCLMLFVFGLDFGLIDRGL